MNTKLMEYFNKRPRIATLSTADKNGKIDNAVFGSPQMTDVKTVVLLLRKNRTLVNIQENPYAVLTIMEPGETHEDWKGVRVYLKMIDFQTSGEMLETRRRNAIRSIGEAKAKLIKAAVTLEIYEVRPIDDLGQGWEAAI